jgi:hypothetical protein
MVLHFHWLFKKYKWVARPAVVRDLPFPKINHANDE